MSNYYHWDTGRDNKFSAVLDANFSKLRNFEGKAAGFTYGPKQSYTLDMDYDMDTKNRLNLVLDYDKENLQYQGTSSISKRIQNRKTAALTYEGESTNSKYSLTSTYSQFENETSDKNINFGMSKPATAFRLLLIIKLPLVQNSVLQKAALMSLPVLTEPNNTRSMFRMNIVPAVNCC